MDKVYIKSISQWSTMVRTTNFDNEENDSQGHGSPNAQQGKNNRNLKSGGTIKENPSQLGQWRFEDK